MALVFNTCDAVLEGVIPTGYPTRQEQYEHFMPPKKLFLQPGEVTEVPDSAADLMLQKLKVRGLMPFSLTDDKEKVRAQGRRNYFDFVVAYLKEVERQEVLAKHQGRLPAPPGPHVELMWAEYERLLPEFKHVMGRKAPKITQPDPEASELAQAARRMEEADIEFARQAKAATPAKAAKPAEA